MRFREILEDDPLWVTTVPPDIQETILTNVDRNRDDVIDYEEFMELIKGRQLPGVWQKRPLLFGVNERLEHCKFNYARKAYLSYNFVTNGCNRLKTNTNTSKVGGGAN